MRDIATKVLPLCSVYHTLSLSIISHGQYDFCQMWLISACNLFLHWPALPSMQTNAGINNMLKYGNIVNRGDSKLNLWSYNT